MISAFILIQRLAPKWCQKFPREKNHFAKKRKFQLYVHAYIPTMIHAYIHMYICMYAHRHVFFLHETCCNGCHVTKPATTHHASNCRWRGRIKCRKCFGKKMKKTRFFLFRSCKEAAGKDFSNLARKSTSLACKCIHNEDRPVLKHFFIHKYTFERKWRSWMTCKRGAVKSNWRFGLLDATSKCRRPNCQH
jgi:hypothetical protein